MMGQWITQGILSMPRKPQPPMDLVVEGLSTGMVTRTVDKFDDITGEIILIKGVPKARDLSQVSKAKRERMLKAAADRVQRTTVALNKALSTGMPTKFAQPEIAPRLAHNQAMLGDKVVTVGPVQKGIRRL